ncbi:MAG: nitrous oxide reductase accessory protein NosL [Flavobacteriaceae bacterium]|nr:nitrous oxide reductase accessory protein NosL [Flavobacteriaceae bacterium]
MYRLLLTLVFVAFIACSTEPKPINYGTDICDHCGMNIMDHPYGTELVTDKGKVYKFDSTECMLSYMETNENRNYAHILTATMDQPGTLQNALTSSFLVSENLPSPMGANITAYTTKELAQEAQNEFKGEVYDFEEIKKHQSGNSSQHH